MKRFLVVPLLVIAALVIPAASASAAVHSATDLETDCNTDGVVHISGGQVYTGGGTATLTRNCIVSMDPDAVFWLNNITILGTTSVMAVLDTGPRSKILLTSTRIDLGKGGLQLTAGCCAGSAFVPEDHGVVYINNSNLTASDIEVGASGFSTDGLTYVLNSQLRATESVSRFGRALLLIRGGTRAGMLVALSTLTSGNGVSIESAGSGSVTAIYNTFNPGIGTSRVTAGPGGTCLSAVNTPPVPCS